jgi:hypothetical protein
MRTAKKKGVWGSRGMAQLTLDLSTRCGERLASRLCLFTPSENWRYASNRRLGGLKRTFLQYINRDCLSPRGDQAKENQQRVMARACGVAAVGTTHAGQPKIYPGRPGWGVWCGQSECLSLSVLVIQSVRLSMCQSVTTYTHNRHIPRRVLHNRAKLQNILPVLTKRLGREAELNAKVKNGWSYTSTVCTGTHCRELVLNVTGTVTAQAQLTNYMEQSLGSQQFLS